MTTLKKRKFDENGENECESKSKEGKRSNFQEKKSKIIKNEIRQLNISHLGHLSRNYFDRNILNLILDYGCWITIRSKSYILIESNHDSKSCDKLYDYLLQDDTDDLYKSRQMIIGKSNFTRIKKSFKNKSNALRAMCRLYLQEFPSIDKVTKNVENTMIAILGTYLPNDDVLNLTTIIQFLSNFILSCKKSDLVIISKMLFIIGNDAKLIKANSNEIPLSYSVCRL